MPVPSSPGPLYQNEVDAQPLIWKWFFILMQIKLIFTRKVVHLASFWKWGFLELGSGLLKGRNLDGQSKITPHLAVLVGFTRIANSNKIINLTSLCNMNSYTFIHKIIKSSGVSLIVYTVHVSALYLSFSVPDCTLMMRKQGTDL